MLELVSPRPRRFPVPAPLRWKGTRLIAALAAFCALPPSIAHAAKYTVCSTACTGGANPSLTYDDIQHGNHIQRPEVVMIFWQDCAGCGSEPFGAGLQWTGGYGSSNLASPTMSQFIGMEMALLNSPYLAAVNQYGVVNGSSGWSSGQIGQPRLSPMAPVFTGSINGHNTAQATLTDLEGIVTAEIQGNGVPPPSGQDNIIYMVVVPDSLSWCGSAGCNNRVGYNNIQIVVAAASLTNPSLTLGHETVESVTGWQSTHTTNCGTNFQVADVCCNNETWANGLAVPSYWSAADGACVIPESWGWLQVNANQGGGWSVPPGNFPMRQAYGGGGGVVATDTTDHVYYYSQSAGEWWGKKPIFCLKGQPCWAAVPIGGSAAEFAVGGNTVAAIGQNSNFDTSTGVTTYNLAGGQGGQWTNIGMPPVSPAVLTSLTVASDSVVVVTDSLGNPWFYLNGSWMRIPA